MMGLQVIFCIRNKDYWLLISSYAGVEVHVYELMALWWLLKVMLGKAEKFTAYMLVSVQIGW